MYLKSDHMMEKLKSSAFIWTVCIGIFVSPFVFWPRAQVIYEIPRVWFLQRWIEILVIIALLFELPQLKKTKKHDTILSLLLIGFLLVGIIASVFGVDLTKSLWGNFYRRDGLVTLLHLVTFSFLIGLFWKGKYYLPVVRSAAFGSFAVSILTIIDGLRLFILHDSTVAHWEKNALVSTFGNPNFLAGFLVVSLPLVFFLCWQEKNKYLQYGFIAGLCIQIWAIFLTQSWGGFLGVLLFFSGILFLLYKKYRLITLAIFSTTIVLVGGVYIRNDQREGFLFEGRQRIFTKIILGTLKRPIFGYGVANSDYAFQASVWPIPFQHDIYVDKAHSILLEVFATTGMVGLVIYILLTARIFLNLRALQKTSLPMKRWSGMWILVLLLYLIHSQTNVISIGEELFFWFVAGIALHEGFNVKASDR